MNERLAEAEKTTHTTPPDLPKEEDILADERRQFIVSLLLSKLHLSIPDSATGTKVVSFKATVAEDANPLFATIPSGVKPVLVKRRRLSTTEEIEAALLQASEMEVEINVKLHEAEDLENFARP